jgi:putative hydrolase of the HAD superfamily
VGTEGPRSPVLCDHRPMIASGLVRLVLFDLDGTLVDHDRAAAAAVERWLRAQGWADAGTIDGHVSAWDVIAERHFVAYRAGLTTFAGQRRRRLRDFLPRVGIDASSWSDERLDDTFAAYLVAYESAWRVFPDAEGCVEAIGHLALVAVLSNGDQEQQELKVSRTGLGRHLGVVLTSGLLGVAKPDPRVFELACGRLGVPAHATVYVGDRLEVDAVAATAAGLRGIWLNRKGAAVPTGVEAIDDLTQLPSLIAASGRGQT